MLGKLTLAQRTARRNQVEHKVAAHKRQRDEELFLSAKLGGILLDAREKWFGEPTRVYIRSNCILHWERQEALFTELAKTYSTGGYLITYRRDLQEHIVGNGIVDCFTIEEQPCQKN